ncbi:MAG: cation:proton antiporter [Acidobacteria bacterium]|nr:cation:proton antiporter [Acidobacteriota bacterium]
MSTIWFVIAGALLIGVALTGTVLKRLPLTTSMFYLAIGAALGPWGANLLPVELFAHVVALERLTEIAVLVSLFTAGLKLRLRLTDPRWRPAWLLAIVGMTLTIAGIAAVAVLALGLPLPAAVLLAAVLAPTDPVLASEVQVEHEHDAEPVRFGLTGEAGLNDGTAFPFVMLGLGLLGAHELGPSGARWLAVDLLWAVAAGLAVGTACGAGIGRLVIHLRREHREAVGLDEFLALGLIGLSYGVALLVNGYGFLAVFAAGLSVRRIEREHSDVAPSVAVRHAASTEEQATGSATAPAYMASAVLAFNEQLERLGELAVVLVVGALLAGVTAPGPGLVMAAALFFVVRPLAVAGTLWRSRLSGAQRAFIAWFGVRGVGSIYYLAYALAHGGVPGTTARVLADITLVVVASSIVLHGATVTTLMKW